MNDVFDEDLMKELGLEPDEIESMKDPAKKAPSKKQAAQPEVTQEQKPAPKKAAVKSEVPKKEPAQPKAEIPKPKKRNPIETVRQETPPVSQEDYNLEVAGEVPVQLAAVLGKKTLSLREVIELQNGDAISFGKKPNDQIDLVANGKLVAKAELVQVDGQIGARIVKLIR